MRPGGDAGADAWALLLRTRATLVGRLGDIVEARAGLPLSWYDLLLVLRRAGDELRMQELAAGMVLSRTRVSRVVAAAERAGLVARRPDPEDGRAVLTRLTHDGRAALRRAAPVYLAAIDEHFTAHLRHEELAALRVGLSRVLDAQRGTAT